MTSKRAGQAFDCRARGREFDPQAGGKWQPGLV